MNAIDPLSLVVDYCTITNEFSLRNLFRQRTSLEEIVASILRTMIEKAPLERWSFIQAFKGQCSSETMDLMKVNLLKQALCEAKSTSKWKEAILGFRSEELVNVHTLPLAYSNSTDVPIDFASRILKFPRKRLQATFGSTFATNKPNRIGTKGDLILDAAYGCSCFNSDDVFDGFALAIGDGSGGHFGDEHQDKKIGKVSHLAVKTAVRCLASYHNPDQLAAELLPVLQVIKQEMLSKEKAESTTLACCRAFPLRERKGFRVIGLNIGDNMAVAWDHARKKCHHLLPSRCSEAGTALLPETFRTCEVQIIDIVLPDGCLLFLMTDGVHDSLPHVEEEKIYPTQLTYRERTLNKLELILKDIPDNAPAASFMNALVQKAFEQVETVRKDLLKEDALIGDDFSIILCSLEN